MTPDQQDDKRAEREERKADKAADEAREAEGVASVADNRELEHTEGGATTRDDTHDLGVPMLQGSHDVAEPVGPEDALGRGDKRGDYAERIGPENYHPHQAVPVDGGGEPVYADDGETIVDYKPTSRLEPQRPRVEERGDAEGQKGGVDTDPVATP